MVSARRTQGFSPIIGQSEPVAAIKNRRDQWPTITGTAIQIDPIAKVFGGIKRRVTRDDHHAVIVSITEPAVTDPYQIILDLCIQRQTGTNASVHE